MNRRELVLLLAGAVTAAHGLRAQQKAMPVIGYLTTGSPDPNSPYLAAFRQGLSETGYVEAGGLISYSADLIELYRRAAVFVDKILKGAKPADLPIEQPTKFELVVNMRAAKAIGLTIPPSLLLRADQVIE